ncbi:MAG: DUF4105 domain-containing protein, partial [Bacteroidetes bacterium]|nr:DUF4105 domain-containing protein [Bacteroidota bacterium]
MTAIKRLGFILFLFVSSQSYSQEFLKLSQEAEISLLTCTPGDEVYSVFGHSAVRVWDTGNRIDIVYNYGTFSYATENFMYKFLTRTLDFQLSRQPYRYFEEEYREEERGVSQQVLNLRQQQKQELFEALEKNYLPENRYYRYDHFFDNCATRIRDILETTLGDDLEFRYNGIDSSQSFRKLIESYLNNYRWLDFGIDIGLGSPTDRSALPREFMFLPDYLYDIFSEARISDTTALTGFVRKSEVLFPAVSGQKPSGTPLFLTPLFIFWIVFALALILTIQNLHKKKVRLWFDLTWFFTLGVLGLVVFFLWFFTDHGVTENNLNILWAVPVHFFAVFLLIPKRKPRF